MNTTGISRSVSFWYSPYPGLRATARGHHTARHVSTTEDPFL
jgi:hypothetical protein